MIFPKKLIFRAVSLNLVFVDIERKIMIIYSTDELTLM